MSNKIPAYVLSDFLKVERKIYTLGGKGIGRPISFKTLGYFFGVLGILFVLGNLPFIGGWIADMRMALKIFIAGFATWLLTDVGTENRPPLHALMSAVRYHWMVLKKEQYYKGRVLKKPRAVRFERPPVVGHRKEVKSVDKKGITFKKGFTYR